MQSLLLGAVQIWFLSQHSYQVSYFLLSENVDEYLSDPLLPHGWVCGPKQKKSPPLKEGILSFCMKLGWAVGPVKVHSE